MPVDYYVVFRARGAAGDEFDLEGGGRDGAHRKGTDPDGCRASLRSSRRCPSPTMTLRARHGLLRGEPLSRVDKMEERGIDLNGPEARLFGRLPAR